MTDELTGIANRRALLAALNREMERNRRHPRGLAIIMFDIDHFKCVNDRFGHAMGDRTLQVVTDVAAKCIRSTDMLARYGGEEFVIVAPETDKEQALHLAGRIRESLRNTTIDANGASVDVTASFGVAMMRADDARPVSLLDRADAALYAAKSAGRDQVMFETTAIISEPIAERVE